MYNKGVILVNPYFFRSDVQYQIDRFTAEFRKFNIDLDVRPCNALISYIDNGKVVVNDFPYDFVMYLDKDKYQSVQLEKAGYRVFNSSAAIEICDEKMRSYQVLSNNGINMPTTIPGCLCFTNTDLDMTFMDHIEKLLGYPMVVKESYGSLGKEVYLVNNREELLEKAKKLIRKPHLFQKYIASSHGTDIRIIVIGNKACAWMKRQSEGDFRSNLASGGKAFQIELPQAYREMAEKITKIINLDFAGIDIMIGENEEPIFCEVNSNAFITGIEKVTGVNIAAIYCRHIYQEIYG